MLHLKPRHGNVPNPSRVLRALCYLQEIFKIDGCPNNTDQQIPAIRTCLVLKNSRLRMFNHGTSPTNGVVHLELEARLQQVGRF